MAEEKATLAFHFRLGFVEYTEADAVVELGGRERKGEGGRGRKRVNINT
jgi:hypothetical protein